MKHLKRTLLVSGLTIAVAGSAVAETYRFSSWNPPTEPTTIANDQFIKDLAEATNGEITFEHFTSGVLMPPASHLQGIGDGVAQVGQTTAGYTPSDLPVNNAITGFGFVESDPIAIGIAYADWFMHDPVALAEWKENNIVPVAGFSTPAYTLICNTSQPITEASQMQGLKVRTYALIGTLVKDLGGVSVSMPSAEVYQALQTGALDCASLGAGFLKDHRLTEVAKYSTLTNWSPAFNSPQMSFNRDFWIGLTDEQRGTILELAARAQARAHILYAKSEADAFEFAKAEGHTVVEPGESLKKAVDDWVAAGVGDMAGVAKATFGIEDPEALFASFEPYVTKWGELVRGMKDRNDEEELTQLLLDNMINDLDPATYGME